MCWRSTICARAATALTLNCGYGHGYSVLEVVEAVKRVSGVDFEVRVAPRRAGDPARIVATGERIRQVLGWQPAYADLDTIIRHALAWERHIARFEAGRHRRILIVIPGLVPGTHDFPSATGLLTATAFGEPFSHSTSAAAAPPARFCPHAGNLSPTLTGSTAPLGRVRRVRTGGRHADVD